MLAANPTNRLHCQHPPPPASNQSEQPITPNGRGSKIARRITPRSLFRTIQDTLKYLPRGLCYCHNHEDAAQNGRRHVDVNLLGMWWSAPVLVLCLRGMRRERRELEVRTRTDGKGGKRLLAGFSG